MRLDQSLAEASTTPPVTLSVNRRLQQTFRSPSYLETVSKLRRFASIAGITILIEGESGTGKSYHARYVHEVSQRSDGPFLTAMLSGMDDTFAESELFGHVAGAFTDARQPRRGLFASADGGTLFLDEVGKASQHLQQLLLHVVE